jgi:hypothetical protein
MNEIFEIASQISTPLALGGFVTAMFFFVVKQILEKIPIQTKSHSAELLTQIVNRLFYLALISIVLGFIGYSLVFLHESKSNSTNTKTLPIQIPEKQKIHSNKDISNAFTLGIEFVNYSLLRSSISSMQSDKKEMLINDRTRNLTLLAKSLNIELILRENDIGDPEELMDRAKDISIQLDVLVNKKVVSGFWLGFIGTLATSLWINGDGIDHRFIERISKHTADIGLPPNIYGSFIKALNNPETDQQIILSCFQKLSEELDNFLSLSPTMRNEK